VSVLTWEFESPLRHHKINRAATLMGCSPFVLSGSDRMIWPVEIYTGRLEKISTDGNIRTCVSYKGCRLLLPRSLLRGSSFSIHRHQSIAFCLIPHQRVQAIANSVDPCINILRLYTKQIERIATGFQANVPLGKVVE
jgi:hypothetical protein